MQDPSRPESPRSVNVTVAPPEDRGSRPALPHREMTDFARRVVVALLITVVILAVVYFLWRGAHVLLQAFAGVLFAVFLTALSEWVQKHTGLPYGWSLAIVAAGLLLLSGGLVYLLWSLVSTQVSELTRT